MSSIARKNIHDLIAMGYNVEVDSENSNVTITLKTKDDFGKDYFGFVQYYRYFELQEEDINIYIVESFNRLVTNNITLREIK